MKKNNFKNQLVSAILSSLLVVSLLPSAASAEESIGDMYYALTPTEKLYNTNFSSTYNSGNPYVSANAPGNVWIASGGTTNGADNYAQPLFLQYDISGFTAENIETAYLMASASSTSFNIKIYDVPGDNLSLTYQGENKNPDRIPVTSPEKASMNKNAIISEGISSETYPGASNKYNIMSEVTNYVVSEINTEDKLVTVMLQDSYGGKTMWGTVETPPVLWIKTKTENLAPEIVLDVPEHVKDSEEVSISANITDPEGCAVKNVLLYVDDVEQTVAFTKNGSLFSAELHALAAGTHTIKVTATDALGKLCESSVQINVTEAARTETYHILKPSSTVYNVNFDEGFNGGKPYCSTTVPRNIWICSGATSRDLNTCAQPLLLQYDLSSIDPNTITEVQLMGAAASYSFNIQVHDIINDNITLNYQQGSTVPDRIEASPTKIVNFWYNTPQVSPNEISAESYPGTPEKYNMKRDVTSYIRAESKSDNALATLFLYNSYDGYSCWGDGTYPILYIKTTETNPALATDRGTWLEINVNPANYTAGGIDVITAFYNEEGSLLSSDIHSVAAQDAFEKYTVEASESAADWKVFVFDSIRNIKPLSGVFRKEMTN